METWVIFALLGMLLSGVFTFIQKVCSQRGYDANKVVGYTFIGQIMSGGILWVLAGLPLIDVREMVALAIVNGVVYFFVNVFRLRALSHIDSAIFFPIHKAAGPTLVVLAGIYIFSEVLSGVEIIGVIMGITVPLLLIHSGEKGRQKNLGRGVIFLALTVLTSSLGAILTKFVAETEGSISLYIMMSSFIGLVLSYFAHKIRSSKSRSIRNEEKKSSSKKLKYIAVMTGFFGTFTVYCIVRSYEGSLAIAYTINSFYILIPIILSFFVYKEHMNVRKATAIILSLTAIIFFQI